MASATPVIVTFEVGSDEGFKVLLTQPDDIANARQVLAGVDVPSIPDGRIVRERGVNGPWSWSLDPGDFTFTDVTDETCDGLPSEIETGAVSGERYCPWSAQVIAIDPAPLTPPTPSPPLPPLPPSPPSPTTPPQPSSPPSS